MKYYIKTFGCQMNISDSERIAGFLEARGFKPAKSIKKANLAIFNTCGVRQMAEDRAYGQVHNLYKKNPNIKIVVTGCLAARKDIQKRLKNKVNLFCEIKDFPKIISNETLFSGDLISKNNANLKLEIKNSPKQICNYLSLRPKYTATQAAYVPIMTGCNNFCSYCVVPYARGREISRPAKDILSEIDSLAKNGYQEITLLGQNVNSYNFKSNSNDEILKNLKLNSSKLKIKNSATISFPKLLQLLATTYPAIRFNFLTSHPKDFSEELMQIIARNKNISREIHLPIQSGSNKILRAMNRPYTRTHYLNLIEKARKIIPNVSFTTDVIVGFPGETEKDFAQTVEIFEKVSYNEAYINKYSPRPGTVAEKLGDPISWEEKKKREKALRKLIK